jgi:hypothetical protein
MLEFYAERFVTTCQALIVARMSLIQLAQGKSMVENWNSSAEEPLLPERSSILNRVPGFRSAVEKHEKAQNKFSLMQAELKKGVASGFDAVKEILILSLDSVSKDMKELGLRFSLAEVERVKAKVEERLPTIDELDNIFSRIRDELAENLFLQVSKEHIELYHSAVKLFGQEVANQFPSAAVFEIDEAAKCIALDRPTASVFHLMRVLEIAIGATRKSLGIPDPIKPSERNWGRILKLIKDEIDRRNSAGSTVWGTTTDAEFFADVHVSLDAVKNVWRNATMHVESKYTPEEAERIWGATRGLMIKLASRLDENGQPLA